MLILFIPLFFIFLFFIFPLCVFASLTPAAKEWREQERLYRKSQAVVPKDAPNWSPN